MEHFRENPNQGENTEKVKFETLTEKNRIRATLATVFDPITARHLKAIVRHDQTVANDQNDNFENLLIELENAGEIKKCINSYKLPPHTATTPLIDYGTSFNNDLTYSDNPDNAKIIQTVRILEQNYPEPLSKAEIIQLNRESGTQVLINEEFLDYLLDNSPLQINRYAREHWIVYEAAKNSILAETKVDKKYVHLLISKVGLNMWKNRMK